MPNPLLPFLPKSAAPAPAAPDPYTHISREVQRAVTGDPEAWRRLAENLGDFAVNLTIALIILVAAIWASGLIAKIARRMTARLQGAGDADTTLQGFMASMVRWIVLIIGLTFVLQQLGVKATSILAMLGAASIAIGLALQGALSNVAAGVMLLILRPYRVGQTVEINGKVGTVKSLDLFTTELWDKDNLKIIMPNSKVLGEMIINYSAPATRRIELNFGIDYEDDMDLALDLLIQCAKADARVLEEPAPWSAVTALADSSVTVTVRAWTTVADYWDARYALIKRVKTVFEREGLSFPYPHQVGISKQPREVDEKVVAETRAKLEAAQEKATVKRAATKAAAKKPVKRRGLLRGLKQGRRRPRCPPRGGSGCR